MIDIYSRYVVHWEIHTRESGEIAEGFIANSIAANGQIAAEVIHSDRGTAMTSQPVSELLSMLGITKSHSRPKTSNDNPYSEAHFKTLKYFPAFPDRFGSIQGARRFCRRFFQYYNHEHYHSRIGLHTPFRCISAPRTRFRTNERKLLRPSARPTHSGSPVDLCCLLLPRPPGSTSQTPCLPHSADLREAA